VDLHSIAKLGRFKDIVTTLFKYGFDDLVQRLDVPGIDLLQKIGRTDAEMDTYERIRHVLEDLGPTFVKFGQIMSLRPDLLPAPLIQELSKLQDDVAPVGFEQIRTVVEKSLGRTIEEVFSIFDPQPLAAASLSQVHKAVLRKEGHIVSVKVQRPGIRQNIKTDLDILETIADRFHEHLEDLRIYDLPNLVRVTRRYLLREIDFKQEAGNMKIARFYAQEEGKIYVPEVYDGYCFEHLLVMEYLQGTKLKDMDADALAEPETIAKNGLGAAIQQILGDGFFHADPHPGNLMISAERGLCLMDWGMVGRLTEKDRSMLIDLLKAVIEKDSDSMVYTLLRISAGGETIDEASLERELLYIMDSYHALPLKDLNMGQLLMAITGVIREYRLRLPPDLVIMIKALVTAEGTARQIYPDLDVVSEAKSHVRRLAAKRFTPEILWRNFRSAAVRLLASQREIPRRFLQILDKIETGRLRGRLELEHLADLMRTLENSSNRLAFSIIIGALIIGSSMIITTGVGPFLFGFPALGVIGYIISGLIGLWLIFNIIRRRKY